MAERKFLLNRVMQKKLLPDESDDDEEEVEKLVDSPQCDTHCPCDSYKRV